MMNDMASGEYRYWAFISYSSRDKKFAHWLHRSIETYGIPVQFVSHDTPAGEPAPRRFRPLFHDRSELPASADLGAKIEEALRASRYLIVVCSPHAAASKWVNKEIETFQRLGRQNQILSIIVEGQPNVGGDLECFPPALRSIEPIAADARPNADGRTNAKLKLLAGMLGVGFDALKQRDSHRRMRRLQLALSFAFALTLVLSGLAGLAWWQRRIAVQQKNIAVERTGRLRTVLSGLIWNLHDKIQNVPGTLALKADLLEDSEDYLSQLNAEEPTDDGLSREVAVSNSKLGDVKLDMGHLSEARANLEKAVAINQRLVGQDSKNALYQFDLASSLREIGAVHLAQGDPDAAAHRLSEGIAILQKLSNVLPIQELVQRELARAHLLNALAAWERGGNDVARLEFMQSKELYESLVQSHAGNPWYLSELAGTYFNLARFCRLTGESETVTGYNSKGAQIIEKLNKTEIDFRIVAKVAAIGIHEMAEALLARGVTQEASTDVADAAGFLEEIRKVDPQDAVAQLILAQGQLLQARILAANSTLEEATKQFLEAAHGGKRLVELDPTNADAWAVEAMANGELAMMLRRHGQAQASHQYAQTCADLVESMRKSRQTPIPELQQLLKEMKEQGVE